MRLTEDMFTSGIGLTPAGTMGVQGAPPTNTQKYAYRKDRKKVHKPVTYEMYLAGSVSLNDYVFEEDTEQDQKTLFQKLKDRFKNHFVLARNILFLAGLVWLGYEFGGTSKDKSRTILKSIRKLAKDADIAKQSKTGKYAASKIEGIDADLADEVKLLVHDYLGRADLNDKVKVLYGKMSREELTRRIASLGGGTDSIRMERLIRHLKSLGATEEEVTSVTSVIADYYGGLSKTFLHRRSADREKMLIKIRSMYDKGEDMSSIKNYLIKAKMSMGKQELTDSEITSLLNELPRKKPGPQGPRTKPTEGPVVKIVTAPEKKKKKKKKSKREKEHAELMNL